MDEREIQFRVDGKTYHYKARVEEEDFDSSGAHNRKIYHTVEGPTGESHSMDWSPYFLPTEDDLIMWVQLGMPDRTAVNSTGPIKQEDLRKLAGGLTESDLTFLKKWAGL